MNTRGKRVAVTAAVLLVGAIVAIIPRPSDPEGLPPVPSGRQRIQVTSSLDGTLQDSYLVVPSARRDVANRPLVVLLHTWSYDLEQRQPEVEAEAEARDWLLLAPNFRGRNDHPDACGSALAQQDVLDAVAWVRERHRVDEKRIYLAGMSGGGFMAMLMAARHPRTWAAVSAWVGISDLRSWYEEHAGDEYGTMMRACLGGRPTDSDQIAAAYRERSPLTYLAPDLDVPIDLAAGRNDPVVSARHTLQAFRALAGDALTETEITNLLPSGPGFTKTETTNLLPKDHDPLIARRLWLRRSSGRVRVTIFEGGHEWFPRAAIAWLATHRRP